MSNTVINFEIYTDQSQEDIFAGFYKNAGLEIKGDKRATLNSMNSGRLIVRNNAIEARRNPSPYESFRGQGSVNFKFFPHEKGTRIICSIQPFTDKVFMNGAVTISLFLLLLTTFIIYVMGVNMLSLICVLVGWLLTLLVLYNGLSHHRNQLRIYAAQILSQMNIAY